MEALVDFTEYPLYQKVEIKAEYLCLQYTEICHKFLFEVISDILFSSVQNIFKLLLALVFKILKFLTTEIGNVRSVSALDTAAVQRARARQQYSTMARLKVTAGTASLRELTFWFI